MTDKFQWAGFTFPRHIVEMPSGTRRERLQAARERKSCGPYYHAPKPITGGAHPGRGGYHHARGIDSFRRVEFADEIPGAMIRHGGWFCDMDQDQTMRGVVVRLTHGRYLSGWTMGYGMCAAINGEIFTDIITAAHHADASAECAAEKEREYQGRWRAAQDARDARDDARVALARSRELLGNVFAARHVKEYWKWEVYAQVERVRCARDALQAAIDHAEQFKDVD